MNTRAYPFGKLVVLLFLSVPLLQAGETEKKLVLGNVKSAGESLTSLQAKMKQRKISAFMEKEVVTKADFYYMKPGKYVLDPSSKSENEYIIVGDEIWIVNDQNKTVTTTSNNEMNFGQYLVGFGASTESLEKLFDIMVGPKTSAKKFNIYRIELRPRKNTSLHGKLEQIIVEIRDDLWLPDSATLTESDGDETVWEFTDYKINPKIKDSVFKLEVPKGYQLKKLETK